jgi:DNA repair protein RecN (Recombination protein N)
MLKSIYISNYALITSLHIDFEGGLSVLTGETGAGKSIILGALSLILGQRADNKSIKNQGDKCVVEALFDISAYKHLHTFFEENDLDDDGNICLIRRELTSNGKSRAFVNDTPVALNTLRDLSNRLIDIHSQHENLLLSNAAYQLEVVDTVAGNAATLNSFQECFHLWNAAAKALEKLKKQAEKEAAELDFLRFQYDQLHTANLNVDEQELLEAELEALNHVEEIKTELNRSVGCFESEDQGTLVTLKEAIAAFSKVYKYVPDGVSKYERMQSAYIDLKDLTGEMNSFQEKLDLDPDRLSQVENRLGELYTLQQKFKVKTVAELVAIRNDFSSKLAHIESFDDEILLLQQRLEKAFVQMEQKATELTASRNNKLPLIENFMVEQLSLLGMPNIQFKVQLSKSDAYYEHGIDVITFLFSANKNRDMQAVEQIASGGEISRLMLTIKMLIANKSDLPTIIFDEIDTGVSGEIAHRMGEIMLKMGQSMQVITITHLPQIAAKGQHHFRVYKDDSGLQSETYIEKLIEKERINEIANMLSGKKRGEAAIQNAKELLEREGSSE